MKRVVGLLLATLLSMMASSSTVFAQTKASDLANASIEDLMNIEVTGVSHKEQRTGDVAAAVAVITQEDIRRSGMTTVPELLRLVPGVQVARIDLEQVGGLGPRVQRPLRRTSCWCSSTAGSIYDRLILGRLLGIAWTCRSTRSSASK